MKWWLKIWFASVLWNWKRKTSAWLNSDSIKKIYFRSEIDRFAGETSIFLARISHLVGHSLSWISFLAIASFLPGRDLATWGWQFSFSSYRKNEVVHSVSSCINLQITSITRSQGYTLEHVLYLASVHESTISELSLCQISTFSKHLYSLFGWFSQFA